MSNRYLFIGGAPRSGTSLMHQLLQDHPKISAFPTEHSVFEKYYQTPEDQRKEYFNTTFISSRKGGQQSTLASPKISKQKEERLKKELNHKFRIDLDHELFKETYLNNLNETSIGLERIIQALFNGFIESNTYFKNHHNSENYFTLKQPYYTDLYAQDIIEELPNSKFIYLLRNPLDRYQSAKKRLVKQNKIKNYTTLRINHHSRCLGHCQVSTSSYYQALDNKRKLGDHRYKIIKFEDLVSKSDGTLKELADWLEIPFAEILTQPTLLGNEIGGGSSFDSLTSINPEILKRSIDKNLVSRSELSAINYYLGKSPLADFYNISSPGYIGFFLNQLLPHKNEIIKQYLWRQYELIKPRNINSIMNKDLLEKARNGKATLSGAT